VRLGMFAVIVLLTTALFVGSAAMLVNVSSTVRLPLAARTLINQGEKIYVDECASCHAKDGSGAVPRGKVMKVPDLRAPAIQKKTDDQLIQAILKSTPHRGILKRAGDEGLRMAVMHMRNFKQ
jgi:mono/diheme cytochrome c family protein